MENGTGKRRLGGGLIYIQDHSDTDAAPQAKLKFKRNPPKNQSRGLAEEKTAQPADFGQHGTSSTHADLRQHMQKCKNQTQTHTLQPGCGGMCTVSVGHRGEIISLPGTGSSLITLALVFNQLCQQK